MSQSVNLAYGRQGAVASSGLRVRASGSWCFYSLRNSFIHLEAYKFYSLRAAQDSCASYDLLVYAQVNSRVPAVLMLL